MDESGGYESPKVVVDVDDINRVISSPTMNILRNWGSILGISKFKEEFNSNLSREQDLVKLEHNMRESLNPKGGAVTARANTINLGRLYLKLSDEGRLKFLDMLMNKFSTDNALINKRIEAYNKAGDIDQYKAEQELMSALSPSRVQILKQFNSLDSGINFLVKMREDVIRFLKDNIALKPLEIDLYNVLSSWFDVGFLDMHQITWDESASLLEKLIEYEAVHKIKSWDDLRHRLDSDRRCFAFFHYKMPGEPLIFVEVALVDEISDNIDHLLNELTPSIAVNDAKVAVFYSISNTQKGLRGVSMGNFLIKRVVDSLSAEFKSIKHFVTLSPIPGFRKWLSRFIQEEDFAEIFSKKNIKLLQGKYEVREAFNKLLSIDNGDNELMELLRPLLMTICAHYLINVRRHNGKMALDSVANFHLSNGARVKRLNWKANSAPEGFAQSFGMMVNYYYDLSDIEDNHEDYINKGQINSDKSVQKLLAL